MLIGVMFKDEWLDIVLPGQKVRAVLVRIIANKYKLTKENADKVVSRFDQRELERIFEKQIKKEFDSYIKNERHLWQLYDNELEKLKRSKKK